MKPTVTTPGRFTMNYFQPDDEVREGVLVLDGEIFRTTGRLDAIGSRVFAFGFVRHDADGEPLRLSVQCERTGERTIAIELTAFGRGGKVRFRHRTPDAPFLT